jgi:hypothetical protein
VTEPVPVIAVTRPGRGEEIFAANRTRIVITG